MQRAFEPHPVPHTAVHSPPKTDSTLLKRQVSLSQVIVEKGNDAVMKMPAAAAAASTAIGARGSKPEPAPMATPPSCRRKIQHNGIKVDGHIFCLLSLACSTKGGGQGYYSRIVHTPTHNEADANHMINTSPPQSSPVQQLNQSINNFRATTTTYFGGLA